VLQIEIRATDRKRTNAVRQRDEIQRPQITTDENRLQHGGTAWESVAKHAFSGWSLTSALWRAPWTPGRILRGSAKKRGCIARPPFTTAMATPAPRCYRLWQRHYAVHAAVKVSAHNVGGSHTPMTTGQSSGSKHGKKSHPKPNTPTS